MSCKYVHCSTKGNPCRYCRNHVNDIEIETHAEAAERITREALEEER